MYSSVSTNPKHPLTVLIETASEVHAQVLKSPSGVGGGLMRRGLGWVGGGCKGCLYLTEQHHMSIVSQIVKHERFVLKIPEPRS